MRAIPQLTYIKSNSGKGIYFEIPSCVLKTFHASVLMLLRRA